MMHRVAEALTDEFGDREPTESEAREFMIGWLVKQGKTPEEANAILDS